MADYWANSNITESIDISNIVSKKEFEDFKTIFYISIGVIGGVAAIVFGTIIGVFIWLNSLAGNVTKKNQDDDPYKSYFQKYPNIPRMKPIPGEELAKRYTMSTGNNDYDSSNNQNNFSRNPLTSRSMVDNKRIMSPSVIGELNNRISTNPSNNVKPINGSYYSGSDVDSFSRGNRQQDVIYFAGGAEKERANLSAY